jgi:hypothetical protein
MSGPNPFLNGANYQTIVGFMKQKYQTQLRTPISERLDTRIQKTVQHYMTEVARAQQGKRPPPPVLALNKDVVRETTASVDAWMKKQDTAPLTTTLGAFVKPDEYNRLFQDTQGRYESMMADREPPAMPVPVLPDFSSAVGDSLEDPVLLMQRAQKQREDQARAMGAISGTKAPAIAASAGRLGSVFGTQAPDSSSPGSSLSLREGASLGPKLEIREESTSLVPPQAEPPPPLLAPRPQEYIIPQEDVVKYRETEYNIFITSADRDWLRNTTENRYNFSVLFNTGTKKTGFSYNTAIQERFRNIQRIEFVKAIVPIESYTALIRKTAVSTFDTGRVVNVFSLPFAAVRIAELNNNGFSTNPMEDNTFAIVQYDTTWSSDLTSPAAYSTSANVNLPATKSGYAGLIPKFLKSQKVYTPAPLATLQRLSIRLERHNQELLSDASDVLAVDRMALGRSVARFGGGGTAYTNYTDVTGSYIFVRTAQYFLYSAVGEGDIVTFQGITIPTTGGGGTVPATQTFQDFQTFINADQYVIAIGVTDGTNITLNANAAGYANCVILRSRFDDPTTGSVARTASYFGGSNAQEAALATWMDDSGVANLSGGAFLNTSRQTHIVLRVITRDMDSASNIRPDNV